MYCQSSVNAISKAWFAEGPNAVLISYLGTVRFIDHMSILSSEPDTTNRDKQRMNTLGPVPPLVTVASAV